MKKFVISNNVTNGSKTILDGSLEESLERLKEIFHVYMQNPIVYRKLYIPDTLFWDIDLSRFFN